MENETKYPELVGTSDGFQFKDENGNLSEEFFYAESYSDGFAVVQKEKDGPYQFRDINGNLSEEFAFAGGYIGGLAVVRKEENPPLRYQYRDINGNLSEEFYNAWAYSDGFAVVQKREDGPKQYRDKNGNLSEWFYDADGYSDGLAMVQKEKDGPYQFRDINGNLSEEFYNAWAYSDGFALVQKKEDGPAQFRDINGNLSEGFSWANIYFDGFALVAKEGLSYKRDILGRVTKNKTKSGSDFYKFVTGKIALEDLQNEHFADKIFYNGVVREIKKRYFKYIDEKYRPDELVDEEFEVKQAKELVASIDKKRKIALKKVTRDKLKDKLTKVFGGN